MGADEIMVLQQEVIKGYAAIGRGQRDLLRDYREIITTLERQLELATDLLEYHADRHLARLAREAEVSARADKE